MLMFSNSYKLFIDKRSNLLANFRSLTFNIRKKAQKGKKLHRIATKKTICDVGNDANRKYVMDFFLCSAIKNKLKCNFQVMSEAIQPRKLPLH